MSSGIKSAYSVKVCPECGELALYGFYCDNNGPAGPHPGITPELVTITVKPDEVATDKLPSL